MDDIQRLMADFVARGGEVRRVQPGEGLHLSRRQWRDRLGYEPEVVVREPEPEHDDRITVVTDHAGREFYKNSDGEWL